jgi:hypothetical protein
MFRSVAGSAALALALFATPVAAEPFDTFTSACLQTGARRDAVEESLTKDGWVMVGAELLGSPEESGIAEAEIYLRPEALATADPSAEVMILTGWTSAEAFVPLKDIGAEFCAVLNPGEKALLDRKMEGLLGFPPSDSDSDLIWVFSRENDGYRAEPGFLALAPDEMQRVMRDRDVFVATTIVRDNEPMTLVGAFRPLH